MDPSPIPDYEPIRALLLSFDDTELSATVRLFDTVYRSSRYRPQSQLWAGSEGLPERVRLWFPTPFSRKFAGWVDAQAEFDLAVIGWRRLSYDDAPQDDVQRDDAQQEDRQRVDPRRAAAQRVLARRFRDAFLEMWGCWRQIVHFLPFVLLAALRRVDDALLEQHAARQLKQALHHYRAFYETYEDDRKRESDQRHLLVCLLKVFRQLAAKRALGEDFVFAELSGDTPAGFDGLFPERFDAAMLLIQQIRNRIVHGALEDRAPDATEPINQLTRACFAQVVAILGPICEAFSLNYVTDLTVQSESALVNALDFSGRDGPTPVAYHVTAAPQLDEFRFSDLRLYLIARAAGRSLDLLLTAQYLDLTPFLIAGRLRAPLSTTSFTPSVAQSPAALRPDSGERQVFALEQYRQPLQELVFLELAGSDQRTLGAGRGDRLSDLLLLKIDAFVSRARLLTAQLGSGPAGGARREAVRSQLWLISREQLGTLIDTRRFDVRGQWQPDSTPSAGRSAYEPELFVVPKGSELISEFVRSNRRALLLVGPSGAGKSNLLVHHYLAQIEAGGLAVFLSGRQIAGASIRELLTTRVTTQISSEWTKLADLDTFLESNDESLAVFIDAINEYSGPIGPVALLADLIACVSIERSLRRCRIVVSCRSETWARLRQQHGVERPLDAEIFLAPNGDAVTVGGFDDEASRRRLYDSYQRHYKLRPQSYDELAPSVQSLLAQPFMMALAAETYSNRLTLARGSEDTPDTVTPGTVIPENVTPGSVISATVTSGTITPERPTELRTMPLELDYFILFDKLTERKKADAQVLVPATDLLRRARLPAALDDFCEQLARMLYARLSSLDTGGAPSSNAEQPRTAQSSTTRSSSAAVTIAQSNAMPLDDVDKAPPMQRHVRAGGALSVLEAALEIGLIEHVQIPRRNKFGKMTPGDALAFFHDQYTQYWLSIVYQAEVLGPLDEATLGDPDALDALVTRITAVVSASLYAPVLAGALDHWLHLNLQHLHDGHLAPLLPLLDRLAAHESGAVRYTAIDILTNLILRGTSSASEVYGPVFRHGGKRLRREVLGSFVEYWPKLDPPACRAFIDACDPVDDADLLDELADIFTIRLTHEPQAVAHYLIETLSPLTLASVIEPQRVRRQFRFAMQFTVLSIISSFDQPASIAAARDVFRSKYQAVIDALTAATGQNGVRRLARMTLRKLLFWVFESVGVSRWDHFMASMPGSGNDRFFESNDGVVQRDWLFEFLPYAVDIHNGEFDRCSLASGAPFRELMLRMLDFRITSVIGYNAVLCLPAVLLRGDWAATEAFIIELIDRRTSSALFHGQLLLANLAYSDPGCIAPSLALLDERIFPLLLREDLDNDWSIMFCVATLDVASSWPRCESMLRQLFDRFEARDDPAARVILSETFFKIAYCRDPELGRRALDWVLDDSKRFLGPLWRECTMKFFAALLTRNPALLRATLIGRQLDDGLVREARQYMSDELVKHSRLFPMQVDVNRFTAWIYIGEPRLRHAVVKHFIGSLATGNSVQEFAAGFRRTLFAIVNVFIGENPEQASAGRLTVEEIIKQTHSGRRRGAL